MQAVPAMVSLVSASILLLALIHNGVECYAKPWGFSLFCRATKFRMPVQEDGCESMTIENSYCYGQCLSQFVPAGWKDNFSEGRMACTVCVPIAKVTRKVVLKCPGHAKRFSIQKIPIIKECKCKMAYCRLTNYYYR